MDRIVNGTEAEPEAEVTPEATPAEAESGPVETEAEFQERLRRMVYGSEAEPEAEPETQPTAEEAERREPETEAEFLERLPRVTAEAEARQEARRQAEDEIRADLGHIGRQLDELAAQMDERQARRDEINREIRDEPGIRPPEPQAEPVLESTWQAGEDRGPAPAPEAEADFEAEIG